jgi:hypothetical protein
MVDSSVGAHRELMHGEDPGRVLRVPLFVPKEATLLPSSAQVLYEMFSAPISPSLTPIVNR